MPQLQQYKVQAPDGRIITVEGPSGAPPDEVIRQAQRLYAAQPAPGPAPDARTATEVAQDQAANVLRGVPKTITGIPGAIAGAARMAYDLATVPALGGQELGQAVSAMAEPVLTPIKGALSGATLPVPGVSGAYLKMTEFPEGNPADPSWARAAEGAGANLGGLLLGAAASKVWQANRPALQAWLQKHADINTARSLRPTSMEGKAITEQIAPEMSQRGIRGLTGKSIDKKLAAGLEEATQKLDDVETRLIQDPRPERQIYTPKIVSQLDTAIARLKVKKTGIVINEAAVAELESLKQKFQQLPKYADLETMIDLRRQLDRAVEEAGGYKAAGTTADRVKIKAQRGAADLVRGAINDANPELKAANQDFAFHRHAMDVVERRKLGEVGESGTGLPGRGSLLDDIIAGWAGKAIGGKTGAAAFETANLIRQMRGSASVKATFQQALADALKQKPIEPKGLLGQGPLVTPPPPDGSGMTITQWRRLLLPQAEEKVQAIVIRGPSGEPIILPRPTKGLLGTGTPQIAPSRPPIEVPLRESMKEMLQRMKTRRVR